MDFSWIFFVIQAPAITSRAPFHSRFFHRNSNSMEITFRSHLDSNSVIVTKFCTWHDSCAVVACAKICCDLMASDGITARRSFHRIWIAGKKSLVKRAQGPHVPLSVIMTSWHGISLLITDPFWADSTGHSNYDEHVSFHASNIIIYNNHWSCR